MDRGLGVRQQRSAIILAGGEGARLRSLTNKIAGYDVPKQFCRLVGDTTLLEQTRQRVSLVVPPAGTVMALTRGHERFYTPVLADVAPGSVVVQPENRETAPAILYSLLRLAKIAPTSLVAIFPSDHYVGDEQRFVSYVDLAFRAASVRPELTVLLGMAPEGPEVDYGWIEPGQPVAIEHVPVFGVRRFWEKPPLEVAQALWVRGCLWNSLVMVARLSTLLGLIMMALPELYLSFAAIRGTLGTEFEEQAVRGVYARLPSASFSEEVLARCPVNLAVLPVRGVEWSDLGEPRRVLHTLARIGMYPKWVA
jgi:mannose-1-phosphate guanylyltransferase